MIVKCPVKVVPDVSVIDNEELVSVNPTEFEKRLDKAICFVEATMKPYTVGSLNGISFTLASLIVVGKARVDTIPSPAKHALELALIERKRLRGEEH